MISNCLSSSHLYLPFAASGLQCYTCDSSKGTTCSYGLLSFTYPKIDCSEQSNSGILNTITGLIPQECMKLVGVGKYTVKLFVPWWVLKLIYYFYYHFFFYFFRRQWQRIHCKGLHRRYWWCGKHLRFDGKSNQFCWSTESKISWLLYLQYRSMQFCTKYWWYFRNCRFNNRLSYILVLKNNNNEVQINYSLLSYTQ